jgi:hypothetical protein
MLTDLLARIEKADGPDRKMDARIHVALCQPGPADGDDARRFRMPARNMDYEDVERGHYWYVQRSGKSLHRAPYYTASLDAAIALVEAKLPGWGWSVGHSDGYLPEGTLYAKEGPRFGVSHSKAETPALALLSALLRALIAKGDA